MGKKPGAQTRPAFVGEHRWTITLPAGTEVQAGDRIVAEGQAYSVLDVTIVRQKGTPQAVQCACVRLGPADGSAGMVAYLQPNAHATIRRPDGTIAPHGADRPVHLEVPCAGEERTLAGVPVAQVLYDAPEALALYATAALITLTIPATIVGKGLRVPMERDVCVGEATEIATPWPAVRVLLIAPSGQEA